MGLAAGAPCGAQGCNLTAGGSPGPPRPPGGRPAHAGPLSPPAATHSSRKQGSGPPLSNGAALAYTLGRIGIIQTPILAAVALWFGALVQETIREDHPHLTGPAPAPAPSIPVLGGSALVMTGVLALVALLFF